MNFSDLPGLKIALDLCSSKIAELDAQIEREKNEMTTHDTPPTEAANEMAKWNELRNRIESKMIKIIQSRTYH